MCARLGSRVWKKVHYVAYAAAASLFVHGILIDPTLKNEPPDPFDGEEGFRLGLCLVMVAATVWRIRYQPKKRAVRASIQKTDYEVV